MKSIDFIEFGGGGASEPLNSRGCKSQKICYNSDIYNHKYNGGFMKKFFAFTLAEVLITLGVIGVVAALTIPTLISQHQKKVYVTQFEKAYNTITNAFRLMQAETGSDNLDDNDFITALNTNSYAEVTRLAKKYFNITQDVYKYASSSGPVYSDSRPAPLYKFYNNSYGVTSPSPYGFLLKTADGADIYLSVEYNYSSSTSSPIIKAFIDVNGGDRAPNTAGRDFFEVRFDMQGKLLQSGLEYNNVVNNCTSSISAHGATHYFCAERIMKDGWQMNY